MAPAQLQLSAAPATAVLAKTVLSFSPALAKVFVVRATEFPLAVSVALPTTTATTTRRLALRTTLEFADDHDAFRTVEPCALHRDAAHPRHVLLAAAVPGTVYDDEATPPALVTSLLLPATAATATATLHVAFACFNSCATIRRRPLRLVVRLVDTATPRMPPLAAAHLDVKCSALPARERAQEDAAHARRGTTTTAPASAPAPAPAPDPDAQVDDGGGGDNDDNDEYVVRVRGRDTYEFLLHIVRGIDAFRRTVQQQQHHRHQHQQHQQQQPSSMLVSAPSLLLPTLPSPSWSFLGNATATAFFSSSTNGIAAPSPAAAPPPPPPPPSLPSLPLLSPHPPQRADSTSTVRTLSRPSSFLEALAESTSSPPASMLHWPSSTSSFSLLLSAPPSTVAAAPTEAAAAAASDDSTAPSSRRSKRVRTSSSSIVP